VKILLTGKNGQVGQELQHALAPLGEIIAYDRTGLDLAVADSIVAAVRSAGPEVLINAAGYTAVDQAEREPEAAHAVNARGVAVLAEEARRAGALLIHYSTDYVFDGVQDKPYVEEDAPNPLNAYGLSKLAGERAIQQTGCAHLILRTSWVYAERGKNFFLAMRRLLAEKGELRIVSDQIGAPTFAGDLAAATAGLLGDLGAPALGERRGVYHMTASGSTSWHGFATAIARLEGVDPLARVVPIPSEAYAAAARRPKNSRLSNEKLLREFGVALPSWEASLAVCHARLAGPR
jgi:dTDP-4-dehydrorhamnose reductase